MKKESLWIQGIHPHITPSLAQDIETDILIIGGGLAGISTAFELRNKGRKVVLIDRDQIGFGASSQTTGKLTYLQELIYQQLESSLGTETADLYFQSQKEAIHLVQNYVKKYHIHCNLQKNKSITFTYQEKEIPTFQKEIQFLQRNSVPYQIKKNNGIEDVSYAIEVEDTYVFHPVKYILALKKLCQKEGIIFYEHTEALTLDKEKEKYLVKTPQGSIRANQVIVTTHYPFFTIPFFLPLRSHIERSYLTASKVDTIQNINAITSTNPTASFRFHQDKDSYFLYVGGSHSLGDQLDYQQNYQKVIEKARSYHKEIDYVWQNHDIMTNDHLPFIGQLKKSDSHLFIATGFNTWGMTNGVLAGKILGDLVLGKENPYRTLFLPYRGITFESVKNFMMDTVHSTKTYALSHFKNYYSFYLDEVQITKLDGKKCGIYIDVTGKRHLVHPICPHLKCGLTFNTFTKTWDCPCHGSRFSIDGDCLQGPSLYSIRF